MSLDFAGSTHKVDCGSNAVIDDQQTMTSLVWYNLDTAPGVGSEWRHWTKGYLGAHGTFHYSGLPNASTAMEYARATTNQSVIAPSANFAVNPHATGAWRFMASQLDPSTDANCRILVGSLAALAAEPSAYTTQRAGSGAFTSDAAASLIIGQRGNDGLNLDGKVAFLGWWNRLLTDGEIHAQQFRPHVTSGCLGFWMLGYGGTTTVADWSGNAGAGTITGAAVADHVPIPFRRSGPLWVPYSAAAPGGFVPFPRPRGMTGGMHILGGGMAA